MEKLHSGRGMSLAVDEHGEVSVRPSDGGKHELFVSPALRSSTPSCDAPALGRSKHVPVLVSFAELAPLIDPALWPEFTSIQMSDQVIDGPCPSGGTGWRGTIVETLSMELFGSTTVVKNRLDIDFCVGTQSSRANFSLNHCFEGGITYDTGFVEGAPAPLGLSELYAEKALNWTPGSMPCFLPRSVNELILSTALTLGLIEYALRVLGHVGTERSHELWRQMTDRLGELGFDHEAGRLLPHFFRPGKD